MNETSFVAPPLAGLFGDEDHKFQMRSTRDEPAAFFAPTQNHAAIVAERARWLQTEPDLYTALMPDGESLLPLKFSRAGRSRPPAV